MGRFKQDISFEIINTASPGVGYYPILHYYPIIVGYCRGCSYVRGPNYLCSVYKVILHDRHQAIVI